MKECAPHADEWEERPSRLDPAADGGAGLPRPLDAGGLRQRPLPPTRFGLVLLSALVVGDVYCSVISACSDIFDFHRAREWTDALTRGARANRTSLLIAASAWFAARSSRSFTAHGPTR